MATLAEFLPPSANPTICERNSQLINDNVSVLDYRKIAVNEVGAQRKNLACEEKNCKPAFISHDENLINCIKMRWSTGGVCGILDELTNNKDIPYFLQSISSKVSTGVDSLNSHYQSWFPEKMQTEYMTKKPLLACHPHTLRLALVMEDNSVKIVNTNSISENENEVLLKDKRINKITSLAWRPKSSMSIAVGSDNGMLVWLLDPSTTTVRPGSAMTRFLYSKDMVSDVTSIAWCPDGKLLACSCKNSTTFWVWNVISQKSTAIHRVGSATTLLKWSPCGQRLLAASDTGMFRIWETKTWTCEKWTDLNGKCTNACWSTCGSILLFTVANEANIYYTQFYKSKNSETIDVSGCNVALKCADLTRCSWPNDLGATEIGGLVSNMVWDPTSSRLAVSFHGDTKNQAHIALFQTRITPHLQLIPCGFINGADSEIPETMEFVNGYDKGALLAVYWSNQTVSMIPLLYKQNLTSSPRQNLNLTQQQASVNFNHTVDDVANVSVMQNDVSLYSTMME